MLARIIANTPPAEATPTSKPCKACAKMRNARLVDSVPGPPPVVTNISAKIESKKIGEGLIEITLIHDGQEDDSQRATKIVMKAELIGQKWTVHEIKTNRKCWDGRGHTDWGTGWCN